MKTVAIIQARMGSSRLPGKMMEKLGSRSLIELVIKRVQKAQLVDTVVLATGDGKENKLLLDEAARLGVVGFAGSEDDVLDRYYNAAKKEQADTIVRITGDCPFIEPAVIDKVISLYQETDVDYASNIRPPTFPDGLDVEVFSFTVLEKVWKEAKLPSEREHVTSFIANNRGLFTFANLENDKDLSHYRITVDEPEDLHVVRKIIDELQEENCSLKNIVTFLEKNKDVLAINKPFKRNEGYIKSLQEDIVMKYAKSTTLLEEAKKVIPTASQTYSKSYKYFCEGAAPAFLERGDGGKVYDIDGNEFLDFVLALGPVTIGYNNEEINKVVSEQLQKGVSFSLPTELEVKLAKKLVEIIPAAEMVKFVKNGSDATTVAIRLARAYTGRDVVLCSGYHGYHDWYIGTTTNNKGVPRAVQELTKIFNYNDIESVRKLFSENEGKVAAVILEPCQEQGPKDHFLEELKELTHQNGAVLIFDEVVSGFRMGLSGAQGVYCVTPDLAAFGKGMANGFSLSAVVGKKEIMMLIDGRTFISTTFGGETLPLVAALKTIEILERPGTFSHILGLGQQWFDGVKELITEKKMDDIVKIYGISPHCGVIFNDYVGLTKEELLSVYQQVLLEQEILTVGVNNFCKAHTEEDINHYLKAVDMAFDKVKEAISQKSVEGFLKGKLIRPIFVRRKEIRMDAVVVLAHEVKKDGSLSIPMQERIDKGIAELKKKNARYLILSGGYGHPDFGYVEPVVVQMEAYALKQGVPKEKIILEADSRDTASQAIMIIRNIILPKKMDEVTIVTSDWHIERTKKLFDAVAGDKIKLFYEASTSSIPPTQKITQNEIEGAAAFQRTFHGINPGDISAFYKRLYQDHPYYRKEKHNT